jgi:hypothetical protein
MAQLGVRRRILARSLVVAKDMTSMSLNGLSCGILNMSVVPALSTVQTRSVLFGYLTVHFLLSCFLAQLYGVQGLAEAVFHCV